MLTRSHQRRVKLPRPTTTTLGDHLRALVDAPDGASRPALVVQGGGLRGIYSMGALAVLEEEGLRDAFSVVIGSSAGAINAAYFLAGQAREGVEIYCEELSGRRFVSPLRFWKIVDVDYMVDVALKRDHPLDVGSMLSARGTLYTVLTDADTAEAKIVSNREPAVINDIYELFRATAALPGLYNRRVQVGDRRYVDGGIAGLVPLDAAFTQGAKNAIVLLTRGAGHRRSERGPVFSAMVRALSHGQSRAVRAKICAADRVYNKTMEALEEERRRRIRATWTVRPSDLDLLVNRTTNDRRRLWACAELARADMCKVLAQPAERVIAPAFTRA